MARPKKERPNRSDGTYEVKVKVAEDMHGKPIRKSFYSSISKADAKAKAEKYIRSQEIALLTGEAPEQRSGRTFESWAMEWLATYKKGKVKEHTYLFTYASNVEKYIVPYFGKSRISSIRQIDVQKYFNSVRAEDGAFLSKSVLEKQKMILKSIFDAAIDNDLCARNPVKNIIITDRRGTQERNVYSRSEADSVIQYANSHSLWGIVIMLQTGIRRSELLGLKWSDIDFSQKTIHIQRSVVQTKGEIVIGDPKTKTSNRYIPFSDDLLDTLFRMNRCGDYVVGTNKPQSPSTFAKHFSKAMHEISQATGAPILTPHELRHTYGTLLRDSGADIYTIQKVMGHSDISVTAGIYVHNDIEVLRRNLNL